jgi:predicted anti-sigma-YlaC factor YlaD
MSPFANPFAKLTGCQREKDVAELVKRGQWPALASAEMQAHVAGCSACRDLVAVAQAFQRERAAASAQARLESPGVLWWRAQLRKRNAALKQVSRPLLAAEVFAVALGFVAAVLGAVFASRSGAHWLRLGWLGSVEGLVSGLPSALHIPQMLPEAWQNTPAPWLVLALLAALGLMGGVFVYKASEDR